MLRSETNKEESFTRKATLSPNKAQRITVGMGATEHEDQHRWYETAESVIPVYVANRMEEATWSGQESLEMNLLGL